MNIRDSDYSLGNHRSKIGHDINRLAIVSEKSVGDYLINKFGEICVHEEKKYGAGKNRVDFYVFAKPNFAVEVFNTYKLRNLLVILNMKLRKFRDFHDLIFFVVTGADFSQSDIEDLIKRKRDKSSMTSNMKCVAFNEFKNCCQQIHPLKIETPIQTSAFNNM